MRTFAQKLKATQQTRSAKSTLPGRAQLGQSREVSSILHLQRLIGNQAVQRLLEANTRDVKGDSTTEIARFGHDFSRIPVHAATPMPVQPRVTTGAPWDHYDKAADRRAGPAQEDHRPTDFDRAAQAPDHLARDTFSFETLRIFPIPASAADARSSPTIPTADGGEPRAAAARRGPCGACSPTTSRPCSGRAPAARRIGLRPWREAARRTRRTILLSPSAKCCAPTPADRSTGRRPARRSLGERLASECLHRRQRHRPP